MVRVPSGGRVAVAASPDAVGGPRATLQLGQLTLGLRGTLGGRGEEAVAHCIDRYVALGGLNFARWWFYTTPSLAIEGRKVRIINEGVKQEACKTATRSFLGAQPERER